MKIHLAFLLSTMIFICACNERKSDDSADEIKNLEIVLPENESS